MTPSDAELLRQYRAAAEQLAALPTQVSVYRAAGEAAVLEVSRILADAQRVLSATRAVLAGEIAHRSSPELGSRGLAQRTGFRTAEEFVRATTRLTGREAARAVRIGRIVHDAQVAGVVDAVTGELSVPEQPWLAVAAAALADGSISAEALDAIRAGLGAPNSAVSEHELAAAVGVLTVEAAILDPDRVLRRARQLRDELDETGIAVREEEHRALRSARLIPKADGGGVLVWRMDRETFALAKDLCDRVTSPRHGGPRFVNSGDAARAAEIATDTRTTEQLLSDSILELLRVGSDADSSLLLGSGAPVVRVTVTRTARDARAGFGRIEVQSDPVSIATVERLACAGDTVEIGFDGRGQVLDVGRSQRLFTARQKLALAVRDGGCRFLDCDRPPSWCEAHHVAHWARDRGATEVANGILLCRHHHLLVHNNEWEIVCDDQGEYWLVPPPEVDPEQKRLPMPSRSAAMRDLARVDAAARIHA